MDDILVSEYGEVMIKVTAYNRYVNYYDNVSVHNSYVRLEGIPIIVSAYIQDSNTPITLFLLTEEGQVIILNKNNPTGFILDSSPIRELSVGIDHRYVLDIHGNLHELVIIDNEYKLSDLYIPDVKLFKYKFMSSLVIVDIDNKLYEFQTGRISEEPVLTYLDYDVKWLLYDSGIIYVADYHHNVWRYGNKMVMTLSSDVQYAVKTKHHIHTIDVDGNLTHYNLNDGSVEVMEGTYIGFYNVSGSHYLVDSEDYYVSILSHPQQLGYHLPFHLFNFQHHLLLSRRRIASAHSVMGGL